jgi:lipoprotein NlpI
VQPVTHTANLDRLTKAGRIMRRSICVLVVGLALSIGVGAMAQTSGDYVQLCSDPDPNVRLLACSVVIQLRQVTGQALADAYSSRGTADLVLGNQDRAIADFDQAIMLDPNRALVFGYRGDAYLDKGDYDRAIADFDRAAALDPNDVDARYGRARALHGKGDNDGAIADYSRVIELDPNYVEALAYRGLAYQSKEELASAIDDFDEVIRREPDSAEAFNLRGGAYRQMGTPERAIADYDSAIRLDPNLALAYVNRGVTKFTLMRFAEAATDLAAGQRAQPANIYAAFWLHMARRKAGEDDTAELSRNMAAFDLNRWPGPIVRLFRGLGTPEDVHAAAGKSAGGQTRRDQVCESDFYTAEYLLLRGSLNTAVPVLQDAVKSCAHDLAEYEGAIAELGWLP